MFSRLISGSPLGVYESLRWPIRLDPGGGVPVLEKIAGGTNAKTVIGFSRGFPGKSGLIPSGYENAQAPLKIREFDIRAQVNDGLELETISSPEIKLPVKPKTESRRGDFQGFLSCGNKLIVEPDDLAVGFVIQPVMRAVDPR